MENPSLGQIIMGILKSPAVIAVLVLAGLYIMLVFYVANYQKKQPKTGKRPRESKPVPAKKNPENASDDDDEMVD